MAETAEKRGRGRPKGSTNKNKAQDAPVSNLPGSSVSAFIKPPTSYDKQQRQHEYTSIAECDPTEKVDHKWNLYAVIIDAQTPH